LISHPPDENLIAKTGLETLVKRVPCAFCRMESFASPLPSPFTAIPEITVKENEYPLNEKLTRLKLVILFHPSLSLLAQMVLGLTQDFSSRILLHALLTGIPVFAIGDESLFHIINTPLLTPKTSLPPISETSLIRLHSSLKSMIHQYSKTLEEWGMEWIEPDHLFSAIETILERRKSPSGECPAKTQTEYKRLVITEEDIQNRIKMGGNEWMIPDNAIVTDLALELAQKNGLILKRKGG